MVDLNHIFLFIALVSPLVILARAWRPGGPYRGWRIAALIVLAITGVSWIFLREHAGYIGGGAWFAFLFLPAIALRKVTELAARQRYKPARRLATAVQILHPSAGLQIDSLLLRELPGSAGFGDIGVSGARRQFWFSFSLTLPRFCSKFHSVIGPLPKRCTGSARSNHTQL